MKNNPKCFYNYGRKKHTTKSNIGPLDGALIENSRKIAEALKEQHDKVYSIPLRQKTITSPKTFFDEEDWCNEKLGDIAFSPGDILKAINEM